MPPPNSSIQDPFGGKGPFDQYLDPAQAAEQNRPKFDNGQQFNGYEGAAGKAFGIFDKFAEGLSKGRVAAFAKKEQEKQNQWKALQEWAQPIFADPTKSDVEKHQLAQKISGLWAKQQQAGMKTSDAAKDKDGINGKVHKLFSHILDGMAGGPFKSGEPWTAQDILSLMADQKPKFDSPASNVETQAGKLRQEFAGSLPKIEADIKAKDGFNVLTREQLVRHPEMQTFLARAGQISPQTRQDLEQQIGSYPSGDNPQARSRLEYLYNGMHPEMHSPPPTRAEQGFIPTGAGYTAGQQPGAPPQPPNTRAPASVLRLDQTQGLPETGQMRVGPPELDPYFAAKQELLGIASGYHIPESLTAYDPVTKQWVSGVTKEQATIFNQARGREQADQRIKSASEQRTENNKHWLQTFEERKRVSNASLGLRERALNIAAATEGIAAGRLALEQLKDDEAHAPKRAMAKAMMWAAGKGILPSEFADNIDKITDAIETDPEIGNYRDYIIDEVSRIKARNKGALSWDDLTGAATAKGKDAAKPATATAKPASTATSKKATPTTPAPAVHQDAASMGSDFGVDLGGGAATPAPTAGGGHMVWNPATNRFEPGKK